MTNLFSYFAAMNNLPKRYTITAALPYANGPLHIGHIAGAYLPADIYVRYLRLKGREVLFVCGSDEHGAAITLRAKKEHTTPKAIVDKYHTSIKETFGRFGIAFDIYHRTSEPIHHKTSQEFFTILNDKGEFILKETEQLYDQEYKQFLADRYVTGTCPVCAFPKAYGDQCENCGSSLNATELKEPISTLSGKTPVLKKTKHWYLPLDKYQPWLEEWLLEGKKGRWKNNVYGQCASWLKAGLHPRSMTRDLDWGVDVPLPDAKGKKMYVWLDAPIGYISATKQWALDNGKDWKLYWKKQEKEEDNSRLIHFIGKDNIVFHCIIFPSILNAVENYIVPYNVPANEFLNLEGDKLSTSRNWAVWLHEYLDDLPEKEDVLRYVLGTILPENKDSEFTWKDYQAKNNNELVAILGNLVNRVIVLTQKYYQGIVPLVPDLHAFLISLENNPTATHTEYTLEKEVFLLIKEHIQSAEKNIESFKFREALTDVINIAREGNKYLTEKEPWKLWKSEPEKVKGVMFTITQLLAKLGVVAQPFLPRTAEKIFGLLGIQDQSWIWDDAYQNVLVPGESQLFNEGKAPLLFEKIDDDFIEQQIGKLGQKEEDTIKVEPAKEEITFDDFQKMDIRIGTILEAEKVPKTKKLLQFKVDTGLDVRTIVSGVAEFFKPEEMVGKQVPVLVNLKPRKIRGVESQGMLLFAEDGEGVLHLVSPSTEPNAGSSVN
ncbi:MAG: methionine--tRNA ligase [Bacteroidota bacterium]